MSRGDIIDLLAGIGILLFIALLFYIKNKERDRIDKRRENSVGEKYMQLMAAFMRENRGKLTDMSEDSADMEVVGNDDSRENLSINQDKDKVDFQWSLSKGSTKLTRVFRFTNNETQEEIMKVIAEGITEAKKDNQL